MVGRSWLVDAFSKDATEVNHSLSGPENRDARQSQPSLFWRNVLVQLTDKRASGTDACPANFMHIAAEHHGWNQLRASHDLNACSTVNLEVDCLHHQADWT